MKEGTVLLSVGPASLVEYHRLVARDWNGSGRQLRAYRPKGWRERWRLFPVNFNMMRGEHERMLKGRPFRLVGIDGHMARAWFAEGLAPWLLHSIGWQTRRAYYAVLQQMALDGFLAIKEGERLRLSALCLPMTNPFLESEEAQRARTERIRSFLAEWQAERDRETTTFWARVARFRAEGLLR